MENIIKTKRKTLTNITLDTNKEEYKYDHDIFEHDLDYLENLFKTNEKINRNGYVVFGTVNMDDGQGIGYCNFNQLYYVVRNFEFTKFCIKDGEITIENDCDKGFEKYYVREFRTNINKNKFLNFLLNATNNGYTIDDKEFWKVIEKNTKKLRLHI